MRNAINSGQIPGPRSLASGREMAPRDGSLIPGITAFIESPGHAKEVVDAMADEGIDQVKLSMSGESITEEQGLLGEDSTIPDDIVAAAVEAAHARGMRVCGHARSDQSIRQCLQYGVDIIYHACGSLSLFPDSVCADVLAFISDETMDALEVQKDRVFVAPALNWIVGTLFDAESFGCKPNWS